MTVCPDCKTEVAENVKFCPACGRRLKVELDDIKKMRVGPPAGLGIGVKEKEEEDKRLELVPEGVKGWSWGAFVLGPIWAVFNRVWLGLLCLLPFIGILVAIVLGARGKAMAWGAGNWESVEHFQRTQHHWSIAALVVVLLYVLMIALTIIVG